MGEGVHASEIELPEGGSMVTPSTDVIVQISKPAGMKAQADEESGDDVSAEPEVIAKGKGDEEDSE